MKLDKYFYQTRTKGCDQSIDGFGGSAWWVVFEFGSLKCQDLRGCFPKANHDLDAGPYPPRNHSLMSNVIIISSTSLSVTMVVQNPLQISYMYFFFPAGMGHVRGRKHLTGHDQAVVEFDAPPYLGSSSSMVEKLSHLGCEKATVGELEP